LILSLIFPAREQPPVTYGPLTAVRDLTLAVAPGEVMCLVGPSGSGKSSLLRVIAGVERPSAGRVEIDGREMAGPRTFVNPEARAVGMVFQDFALFPHLTVAENVGFGVRGRTRAEVADVVQAMLERVDLTRYADVYPHTLSGGERQRVALARALAPAPRILLMDEPFSSLDSRLRDHVRQQTMDVLREAKITTIVVTHEPDEAMRIADRIALMRDGSLEQVGTAQDIYVHPRTLFAARFFSDVNELPGRVYIRPEHLRIAAQPTSIPARVVRSEFRGAIEHVVLTVDGVPAPVTLRAFGRTRLSPGDAIHLEVPQENVLAVSHDF
jgi:iron(III) transport system ATP-binding protein